MLKRKIASALRKSRNPLSNALKEEIKAFFSDKAGTSI
jgi:hypothetical protein